MEAYALNYSHVIIQKRMSLQNLEEGVMIKFCKSWEEQKHSFTDFLQNKRC